MKTIGLIGGMSWESTVAYYRELNEQVRQRLGGLHSAQIILNSVDFAPVEALQRRGDWSGAARLLAAAAQSVEAGGADFLLLCTNTMHRVATEIEQAIAIPLLNIADATAEVLRGDGIQRVGLLGTAFTMEQEFYKGRLQDKFGLDVRVPDQPAREFIHQVIYQELCLGRVKEDSRQGYLRIIDDLVQAGAEAVILGCTEIGMLLSQGDTPVRLYDTTTIHAATAVDWALEAAP